MVVVLFVSQHVHQKVIRFHSNCNYIFELSRIIYSSCQFAPEKGSVRPTPGNRLISSVLVSFDEYTSSSFQYSSVLMGILQHLFSICQFRPHAFSSCQFQPIVYLQTQNYIRRILHCQFYAIKRINIFECQKHSLFIYNTYYSGFTKNSDDYNKQNGNVWVHSVKSIVLSSVFLFLIFSTSSSVIEKISSGSM